MKSGSGCSVQGAGWGSAHRRCPPPQLARDALGRLPSPPPVPENLLLGLHRKLPSGTPTRRHALGRLPTPPPLPENLLLGLHRKLPSAPPASTQEVRNPKIGQQLGAQPTPRFRGMLDALLDAMFDPLPPFTFCCPQAIVDEDAGV